MPKFKEHFGVGSAEISTVNSIQMGVTFASGEARKLEEIQSVDVDDEEYEDEEKI